METFGVSQVLVLPPPCHALPTPPNVFAVDIGTTNKRSN